VFNEEDAWMVAKADCAITIRGANLRVLAVTRAATRKKTSDFIQSC
jgi:hypothetical protein